MCRSDGAGSDSPGSTMRTSTPAVSLQCRWIAPLLGADRLHLGPALGHDLWLRMPDGVPGVGVARDQMQHPWLARANEDAWASWCGSTWTQRAVARCVILPREVHLPLTQQRRGDLERLFEARSAMIEGIAEGVVLRLVPARADT